MQGKELRKLEAELWRAADQLRANSKLTATEYSMPVLGLIFLRHAYNRYQKVKAEVEKELPFHPQRGRRAITRQDFEERAAMYLPENTHFDYLVNFPEGGKTVTTSDGKKEHIQIGEAIDLAMRTIEDEYENLQGVLPKNYTAFNKELLVELLRIFNKEVLQKAEGDLFGKIYEYFLNKFAMTGAQEGGEFFTPMSLVQTIVNVIEPAEGTVFDPACGSAGMFVQTGYFIQNEGLKPAEKVTFYGQEKAELNTKLAKMNLAVHGLEGKIQEGNTFYEDKHNLAGKCDYVMANPPFNVNGVDKDSDVVKKDPRLMLGGKVNLPNNDNANYLWIQYFYNYLKPHTNSSRGGRAGFVMASSASDAGHSEKDIREKLVKTGAVDVMMAIGNNFFYTRSLPCTLWFFDREKEVLNPDKVLMLDARKIYRKITSKVNDFSPEQLQNLICIVNLYRGNTRKLQETISTYKENAVRCATELHTSLLALQKVIRQIVEETDNFLNNLKNGDAKQLKEMLHSTREDENALIQQQDELMTVIKQLSNSPERLKETAQLCKVIRKPQDKQIKQLTDTIVSIQKEGQLHKLKEWKEVNTREKLNELKAIQHQISGNPDEEEPGLLYETAYYHKQVEWLAERFPDGVYADVEGLCKVVTRAEIEEKDWSLSPGRYVGVASETDEDFDYEERLAEIHIELEGLNEEAAELAKLISENYKEMMG